MKVILTLTCCLALTSLAFPAQDDDDDTEKAGDKKADGALSEHHEKADDEKEDPLSEHQSIDAFCSLEDGTGGPAGEIALQINSGWFTKAGEPDEYGASVEVRWVPGGNAFLDNTEFAIGVPLELGANAVKGNGDIELGWQQRWVREHGMVPTLGTLVEMRTPSGYHSSGVDAAVTGIVAKEIGSGTGYLNLWAGSANGNNIEDVRGSQWGFRAGYKFRATEEIAFIGVYAHETSEERHHHHVNLLEVATEIHASEHVTVGPGIIVGLDNHDETPDFGAGIQVECTF